MEQLENRIRRSSIQSHKGIFRYYLSYASMVRDADQVYLYMQENGIGKDQPEYWVAKLTDLCSRCQFIQAVRQLQRIQCDRVLNKHPKYWLISDFQRQLEKQLQKMLRRNSRGRKSARQYELLSLSINSVEKENRKFGGVNKLIYVDPDCRINFRLEDLAEFICNNLKEECEVIKNCFERENQRKQFSFITRLKQQIEKLSQELIGTQSERKSYRNSVVCRQSRKFNIELRTPDFKKSNTSVSEGLNQVDSCELLRRFGRKSKGMCKSSKKRVRQLWSSIDKDRGSGGRELELLSQSSQRQKIRAGDNENDSCSETCSLSRHGSQFSFSKKQSNTLKQDQPNQPQSKLCLSKQMHMMEDSKNDAFIEDTQNDNLTAHNSELEDLIHEAQMQPYELKTQSEIDSNKQNNQYGTLRNHQQDEDIGERKVLKTLYKKQSAELSDFKSEGQDSGRILYQDLLCIMGDSDISEHQNSLSSMPQLSHKQPETNRNHTNRKHFKRFSRISEERSYSYSEAREKKNF